MKNFTNILGEVFPGGSQGPRGRAQTIPELLRRSITRK
ncbi:hypothetical protein SLNWT_2630 [Streptomyces albus]|uniref:Uncharacterized protein n=1 Tax=Streptomyces albus (strain ATCC 21838 / DSM 41398 / FERM P-419 / JCM 4703 / NBRC 107858) TaxID=1081613 RepID=A0A0B5EWE3_STRA4|nr:hypothetical protein SLNWT_2630 [Streptomyces albus]